MTARSSAACSVRISHEDLYARCNQKHPSQRAYNLSRSYTLTHEQIVCRRLRSMSIAAITLPPKQLGYPQGSRLLGQEGQCFEFLSLSMTMTRRKIAY